MSFAKPLASLSSGLLARKGEARPAMRRQAPTETSSLDDLGWNDLGELPPVLQEREVLAAAVTPAAAAAIGRESAEQTARGKAAFTLRLDAERHLRLRLASAVAGKSAQLLMIDALDGLLSRMPEVAALRAQLPGHVKGVGE
jgi:hypothetical protein